MSSIRDKMHHDMFTALHEIAEMHIPDCPASSGDDELTWAKKHVAKMRKVAQVALLSGLADAPDSSR